MYGWVSVSKCMRTSDVYSKSFRYKQTNLTEDERKRVVLNELFGMKLFIVLPKLMITIISGK